jgi:dihydroorotate dehydrogenase electron transfer subunit
MIFQELAEVVHLNEIAFNTVEVHLFSPKISADSYPGQFINILPSKNWKKVMRRPMSIASQNDGHISIIFKVVGDGTNIMRNWRIGDKVDIIGPLGNKWDYFESTFPILVGGGVGIAPIQNLHNTLKTKKIEHLLIMGARKKSEHFLQHNPSENIFLSTDDGSLGIHGYAVNALESLKDNIQTKKHITFYSCGPDPMMQSVKTFADSVNSPCYLALETIMACGIGICQGCTVELNDNTKKQLHSYRSKFALVCKDGSIFNAKDLK